MNEEEAKKIIDNMSEQELNDFIFFALQEVEKENEYISKEKIKERIKEYYEYDKRMQNKPDWHTTKYYEAKALEKLLEE